jgi:hypothetical protein
MKRLIVWVAASLLAGCSCDSRSRQNAPQIMVLTAAGDPLTNVDFGKVQINTTGEQHVRIRNAGSAPLNITKAEFTQAKFGQSNVPLTVDTNSEAELVLTFTPVDADVHVTGSVNLTCDDPQSPTVTLTEEGTGVTAVAVLNPRTLDFGNVYVAEARSLTLTLTNAGTNDLVVQDAHFTGVSAQVTGDPAVFKTTIPGSGAQSGTFTFTPTASLDLTGTLDLVLGGQLGTLSVPVSGHGVVAIPRLCVKFAGTGLEQCASQANPNPSLNFGALCDSAIFPNDGGPTPCVGVDGGPVDWQQAAQFYVRNEGNFPIGYTIRFDTWLGGRCDGGAVNDFAFGNAPASADGGTLSTWTQLTTSLAAASETPHVDVVYAASSHCGADTADQATITWLRSGEDAGSARQPQVLTLIFTGQSLLPGATTEDNSYNGTPQHGMDVYGAGNAGGAPLRISHIALWQAEFLDGGLRGSVPFEECDAGSSGDCVMFAFDPLDNPNSVLPVMLAGTPDPNVKSRRRLGSLVFGPDAGMPPQSGKEYRVFGVVDTGDPYKPKVIDLFKGKAP